MDMKEEKAKRHASHTSSFNFDNFVTGKANQLAHAAALQVADVPGETHNPLFISGGVGKGKSHLLLAIYNRFASRHENAHICYVHATGFISEVVSAFQSKKFNDFKQRYNSLDMLLIDDIQFIADKPGTQQELLSIVNSMIARQKQVVIACDTPPEKIRGLNDQLMSRFSGGLAIAIEPPDTELLIKILHRKSEQVKQSISHEISAYIATSAHSDVRKLEGALNRVIARSLFFNKPITFELAREALEVGNFL